MAATGGSPIPEMYRPRRRQVEGPSEIEEGDRGWVRCFVIPPILLGLGILIDLSQITWKTPELPQRMLVHPGEMVILVGLAMATMVMGVVAAALMFRANIGRLWVAGFKACGTAVLGTAVAVVLVRMDPGQMSITGPAMGWSSMILIYLFCFAVLFNLEIYETVGTVFVIAVVQAAVAWAVMG